jgi:Fe-S-cluster containining protein
MESEALPRLRGDLEILSGQPDATLIYDPVQRTLFELHPEDLPLVKLLDGKHSLPEIARGLRRPLAEVQELVDDLSDAFLLEDPEQEEMLRALRRRNREEDRLLAPVLDNGPLPDPSVPPIHVVDDARHTCLRCGACCHYAVPVSPEERTRLEAVDWPAGTVPEESGGLFQLRPGLQWGRLEETIATRSDPTRCVFLDENNLCQVHQRLGETAKPFVCRLFPLAFPVLVPEGILFSLTFECPFIYATYDTGEPFAVRPELLRALAAEMEEIYILPSEIDLWEGKKVAREPFLQWEEQLRGRLVAPATRPEAFLETLTHAWGELDAHEVSPSPTPEAFGHMAQALREAALSEQPLLSETPEGTEGSRQAGIVLEALKERPLRAWEPVPWEDGPEADRFLVRFAHHFLGGKQYLLYRTAWLGLRALAAIVLLSRCDASFLARQAGRERVGVEMLNRAVARWCRLLDLRPIRLAYVRAALQG